MDEKPSLVDLEEFSRFNEEMKLYLVKNLEQDEIVEHVLIYSKCDWSGGGSDWDTNLCANDNYFAHRRTILFVRQTCRGVEKN